MKQFTINKLVADNKLLGSKTKTMKNCWNGTQ